MKELDSWEIEEIIDDEDAREKLFATFKAVARQMEGGKTGKVTLSFSMSLEPNGMGGTCLETNVKISGGITQKNTVAARTKFLTVDEGPQMRFDFDGSDSEDEDGSESGSESDSESDGSESGSGESAEEEEDRDDRDGRDDGDAQDEGGEAGKCAHCDENGFCANPDNGGGFKCCNCAAFTPAEDGAEECRTRATPKRGRGRKSKRSKEPAKTPKRMVQEEATTEECLRVLEKGL